MLKMRYQKRQLFFLDETSKDGRALRRFAGSASRVRQSNSRECCERGGRSFGYEVLGKYPISHNAILSRGPRISSLCCMDHKGMVDWEHTDGSYNRREFLRAVRRCVVSRHPLPLHGSATPVRRRHTGTLAEASSSTRRLAGASHQAPSPQRHHP